MLRRISQRINSQPRGSSQSPFNDSITYHDSDDESRYFQNTDDELTQEEVAFLSPSQGRSQETNAPRRPVPIRQGPYFSQSQRDECYITTMSGYTTADDEPHNDAHYPLRRFNPHHPVQHIHSESGTNATHRPNPSSDSGVGILQGSAHANYTTSGTIPAQRRAEAASDNFLTRAASDVIHPSLTSSFTPTSGLRTSCSTHSDHSHSRAEIQEANEANIRRPLRRRSSSLQRLQARRSDSLHQIGSGIDDTCELFREIEGADTRTRDRILEGHLEKIFKMHPQPLVEDVAARRAVRVVRDAHGLARVRSSTAMVEGIDQHSKGLRVLARRAKDKIWRKFSASSEEKKGRKKEWS
jgi:hypothetical protein